MDKGSSMDKRQNNGKGPYSVIFSRYATEKSAVLEGLKDGDSNPSLTRCKLPRYVFLVNTTSNKMEIAGALEEIYAEQKVKVVAVNTINVKPKAKARRRNSRAGQTKAYKKAIVTFEEGDTIDNI
jgi:large subunit ribosomal protein L23